MKGILLVTIIILNGVNIYAQNIIFSDNGLKSFLISENCVDINNDGIYDINADLNNDGEIQLNEALNITHLKIGDYPDTYFIKSIQAISNFSNLTKLVVIQNDSINQISSLGLDSLSYLWIGSCKSLKKIDISDLNHINNLRIEDIDSLDYLNLQNGNYPDGIFSLFYTENIHYACVDSISAEYNEVASHMIQGASPTLNCTVGIYEKQNEKQDIMLFPNPATGRFNIHGLRNEEINVSILDPNGQLVSQFRFVAEDIKISFLDPGVYFVQIETEYGSVVKKLIKQ